MDEKTREALDASIAHWEENLAHAKADEPMKINFWADDCALCQTFYRRGCGDCPVKLRTGRGGCLDTPYDGACRAVARRKLAAHDTEPLQKAMVEAVQDEVDFLKSLLPEEKEA